ncbi:MAG: ABC transporter substrate-binding protein [Actinomycetia bacterium]|nr:ABC transporter substrate-binding protein [Actinomycetes bacterium]
MYEPARIEVEVVEGTSGRCLAAFRVDRFGTRLPAMGVKFLLDSHRLFSVSGRVCTDRVWTRAQAIWRGLVPSRVILNERALETALVVGHLSALSGSASAYAEPRRNSVFLAADHLNRAGLPVSVVYRNTGVDPVEGVVAARELLDIEGAVALVGAQASGVTIAVAEQVTAPAGVLQISAVSTAPAISLLGDNDFLFRTALSDAAQGVVLADLAVELGYETAGVLYIDNPYGQGLAARFAEAFTARGGEVTATVAHGVPDSFIPELEEVTAGNPDVIIAASYSEAEVYLREALQEGYADTFLFVDGTKIPQGFARVGWELLEGSYGTGPGVDASRPETRAFVDAYTAAYGEEPPRQFMNETYDAAVLVGLAAAQAGTVTDVALIRDQLRAVANPPGVVVGPGAAGVKRALRLIAEGVDVNYEGASGPVDLDANGDVLAGFIEVWRVEDGQIVPVRQVPVEPGPAGEDPGPAFPPRSDLPGYTKAFVQQAIDRYRRDGLQATVDYYNSPESIDGQWYVFIGDEESNALVANAAVPALVGHTADQIRGPSGYPIGEIIAAVADEDGGWVDYTFTNPVSGSVETKHSWLITHDGLLFGSGWYEPGPSKSDPPEYTQAFVQQAVSLYDALGLDAAVGYYSSPGSVDGEWYVFIVDAETGLTVAHPNPKFIGRDPSLRVDATGYFYGDELLAATEQGRWVDYVLENPETGESEQKHTWAVRHDGLLFASGWYEPTATNP